MGFGEQLLKVRLRAVHKSPPVSAAPVSMAATSAAVAHLLRGLLRQSRAPEGQTQAPVEHRKSSLRPELVHTLTLAVTAAVSRHWVFTKYLPAGQTKVPAAFC